MAAKSSAISEAKKLTVLEIKRALKTYDKDALVSIIMDCYKQSKDVKNYIHVLLNPEEAIEQLYEKAKLQITNEFFPERGFGKLRLAVAKKAIAEFRELSKDELRTIDLMIHYVEEGVDFTNEYGDINDQFYNSMILMYRNVIDKIMDKQQLYNQFHVRLGTIVKETSGIGWGFHDVLSDIYGELIVVFEEEFEL